MYFCNCIHFCVIGVLSLITSSPRQIWRSTSRQRTSIVHPRSHPTSCAFGLETHNNIQAMYLNLSQLIANGKRPEGTDQVGTQQNAAPGRSKMSKNCLLWNFNYNDSKTPTKTRGIQLLPPLFQATSPSQMLFLITTMSPASIQSILHVVGMESKMVKDFQTTVKARCLCAFLVMWTVYIAITMKNESARVEYDASKLFVSSIQKFLNVATSKHCQLDKPTVPVKQHLPLFLFVISLIMLKCDIFMSKLAAGKMRITECSRVVLFRKAWLFGLIGIIVAVVWPVAGLAGQKHEANELYLHVEKCLQTYHSAEQSPQKTNTTPTQK